MEEVYLDLPSLVTTWLLEGGTAWLEPFGPQPKKIPPKLKYSPGTIVHFESNRKWKAQVKTVSCLRIKDSGWEIIAKTGFPEILNESLSLIEKKYLTESFYNQFEEIYPGSLKKNPWVYFITIKDIKTTAS